MGFFDKFTSKQGKAEKKVPAAQEEKSVVETVKKATAKKTEKASEKKSKSVADKFLQVIKQPLVSEKAASLATDGKYVFIVDGTAGRVQVRQAIKAIYGVTPVSVNVMNVSGKAVRFGQRAGRQQSWKKAIVTLPKGKTIDIYEGV